MASRFDPEIITSNNECLILVHPEVRTLETLTNEIRQHYTQEFHISKELSGRLLSVSPLDRSRISQQWLTDVLVNFTDAPVLCTHPDLLFEPSLALDPFTVLRNIARIKRLIVLWPGEYASNVLSYATPSHHHYRTWKITNDLLMHPSLKILRLPE